MSDDRAVGRYLFCFFLALYLLAAGDHATEPFYSSDETLMAQTTVALVEHASLHFPQSYGVTTAKFGILQSVAAIPFYLAARPLAARLSHEQANLLVVSFLYATNALIAALLIALFYRFSRYLRYPRPTALVGALTLGLTTVLFPYAKMFFSEPLVALMLLGSVFALTRYGRGGRRRDLAVASLLWGLAILARSENLTLLPVYLLVILTVSFRREALRARAWRRAVRDMLVFGLTLAPAALTVLAVNAARFGSPWRGGYGEEAFSTPLLAGLYGLLVSPGRGLLVYSPALLLVPFVFSRFWRRRPLLALVIVEIVALKLFFFSKWWSWQGGWSWGARFLLPLVPLLWLALGELFLRWRRWSWGARTVTAGLLLAGLCVQAIAVLANPNKFGNDIWTMIGQDENQFLFIPQLSFLSGNWRLIQSGLIDSFLVHGGEVFGRGPLTGLLAALVGLLGVAGVGLWRRGGWPRPRGASAAPGSWFAKAMAALALLNVLVFATAHIATESNKIPRERRVVSGEAERLADVKLDRFIRMDENWREPGEAGQTSFYRWRGWLVMPLSGDYQFNLKASGYYHLRIGEQVVFDNQQETQQHLRAAKLTFKQGVYPLEMEYHPVAPDYRLLNLYWTLPGFGVYRGMITHQDVYAERPTALTRALAALDQFKLLIVLLSLMLAAAIKCGARSAECGVKKRR